MLTILHNGINLVNFTQASVQASICHAARGYDFSATATRLKTLPFKKGDSVFVMADGKAILKGFIEKLTVGYSGEQHHISVSGRSLTADLVDSSVGPNIELDNLTLKDLAMAVINSIGAPLVVKDELGLAPFKDLNSIEVGSKALGALEKHARKRQALISTDGLDAVLFISPGSKTAPTQLQLALGDNRKSNNVLNSEKSEDDSNRFNKYVTRSALNPGTIGQGAPPSVLADQSGVYTDNEIRPGRLCEFTAEESSDSQETADRAKWEALTRKAKSFTYKATVVGHTVNGLLWEPNALVSVTDDYAEVFGQLLITDVNYDYSVSGGSLTHLTMTYPEAFRFHE